MKIEKYKIVSQGATPCVTAELLQKELGAEVWSGVFASFQKQSLAPALAPPLAPPLAPAPASGFSFLKLRSGAGFRSRSSSGFLVLSTMRYVFEIRDTFCETMA